MRKLLMVSAAVMLGTASTAALADHHAMGGVNSIQDKRSYDSLDDLDETQRAEYDAWPADYQTMYMGWPADYRISYWGWPANYRSDYWNWPADYQTYYWTLTPDQQTAYWALTNEQRAAISSMTEAQRAAAWNSIANQMADAEPAPTTTQVRFVSNEVAQQVPAPRAGDYPVCNSDADDSCINAWATGARGAGVDRPLGYWPGKPASE